MHALLLSGLVLLATDANANDPSRFYAPTAWDVTLTVKCDGATGDPNGDHTDFHDVTTGHARVVSQTAVDMGAMRMLSGEFQGSATVDETTQTMTRKGKQMRWDHDGHPGDWWASDFDPEEIANGGNCTAEEKKERGDGHICHGPVDYESWTTTVVTGTGSGADEDQKPHVELVVQGAFGAKATIKLEDANVKTHVTVKIHAKVDDRVNNTEQTNDGNADVEWASDDLPLPASGMTLGGTVTLSEPCRSVNPADTVPRVLTWSATPVSSK